MSGTSQTLANATVRLKRGTETLAERVTAGDGQRLTGAIGKDVREYLVEHLSKGKRGSADLCSYFLLRNLDISWRGRVGIIATKHHRPGRHPRGRPRPGSGQRCERLPRREVPTLAWHDLPGALEEDATRIINFEPVVVSGLQTVAYARAVISTAVLEVTPREIEAKVAARMAR